MAVKISKETKVSQLSISSENYKIEIFIQDDRIDEVDIRNQKFNSPLDDICDDGIKSLVNMSDEEFEEMLEVVNTLRKELKEVI